MQQALLNMTVRYAVPDSVGRKTPVALVYKSTLIALLLINLGKTIDCVLRIISLYREGKPSTKQ
ncbi:hypothetical protein A988_02286 [Pseudomonas syringae BRIP39023]|nr:hypothetical protein A988_02286 [Pseudomonas syringae BRIP39023]